MVGAELTGQKSESEGSSFPQIVAWCSLVIALLLFFGNLTPALRERTLLRATSADLQQLRQRLEDSIAHARPGATMGRSAGDDLQSVLIAIDRIGWTPGELLQSYPEPQQKPPVDVDPASSETPR
ncbi:MAG: hypothetical protein WCR59_10085 [Planctomycetota bacterium]|jgi:hypothetical protein